MMAAVVLPEPTGPRIRLMNFSLVKKPANDSGGE
jgi:hypothetical protein